MVGTTATLGTKASHPDMAAGRRLNFTTVFLFIAVLLGTSIRLREYAFDRSLWLDELSLTRNIVGRGFGGLLKPLGSNQAAPIGFLWAERASIDVFGNNEMALRLVPVLGSVFALAVFAIVARRLLPGPAAVAAAVLFATSPNLIFYSSEVKQYSTDVLATLLLVWWTLLIGRRPTVWTAFAWGTGAAVVIWFSQPAIPVAVCCVGIIAVRAVRSAGDLLRLLPGGAAWFLSLLAEYVVALRAQARNAVLKDYWRLGYAPRPVRVHSTVSWLHSDAQSVLTDPLALRHTDLGLLLGAVGVVVLLLRHRIVGLLLVLSPVALGVALAIARLYPLRQRLALYLLPLVVLLMCGALAVAPARRREAGRVVRAAAAALTLVILAGLVLVNGSAVARGVTVLGRPIDITDGRAAVAFVGHHQQPGDLVLGERGWAQPTFSYYGPRDRVREDGSFGFTGVPGGCDAARQLEFPPGTTRVWIVLTHRASFEPLDRNAVYLSQFGLVGRITTTFTAFGDAGAYLLQLGVRGSTAPGRELLPKWAPGKCLTVSI